MLNNYRSRILLVFGLLIGLGAAPPVSAQSPDGAYIAVLILAGAVKNTRGVRAGFSHGSGLEQGYVGVHFGGGPGVTHKVRFRPNVEIGFGDYTTSWALNGEVAYFTRSPWESSEIYLGSGPALNVYRIRSPSIERTDTGAGVNFLLGIARRHKGPYAEIKAGILDSPTLKLGIGYTFR